MALCALLLGMLPAARAFVVNINNGSRQLYFRVGDTGTGINTVSANVSAAVLGNGVAQQMRSNAVDANSEYDGVAFCNLPNEVYVGGYFRRPGNGNQSATLTIDPPTDLTSVGGTTIPFSDISWTSSGIGDSGAQPFPAGSFSGDTTINFPANTWRESCHSFKYANTAFVAAGTYSGRVLYTLSSP